ncbi:MAG: DoxX family protein [Bacteroidetes bacterium]|nr:DoxX family protein [Bacteroidota bacterium]
MEQSRSKGLHITLWIVQVLLAGMFMMAGVMKTITPIEELVKMGMTWAESTPFLPRFIGISEILGGLGLILPALLRIQPKLTVWAAYALALVMGLAIIVHLVENDAAHTGMPLLLGVLAYFVAWGRSKKALILAR